jgi:hypothetical protein
MAPSLSRRRVSTSPWQRHPQAGLAGRAVDLVDEVAGAPGQRDRVVVDDEHGVAGARLGADRVLGRHPHRLTRRVGEQTPEPRVRFQIVSLAQVLQGRGRDRRQPELRPG